MADTMTKRSAKAGIWALGILLLGTATWWWVRPAEPNYSGQPLADWLEQLESDDSSEARAVLQAAGPEAVPFILRQVKREFPATQRAYALVWRVFPVALRRRLAPPVPYQKYGNPSTTVVRQLATLNPAVALPGLIRAFRSSDSQVQITALAAVGSFGSEARAALPSLMALMRHPNGFVRRWAIVALGSINPGREQAIPALIAALNDPETSPLPGSPARVRETAARVLGDIGPPARAAAPELRPYLTNANPDLRREAAIALWKIERDREVLPVLISDLERTDGWSERRAVAAILGDMGPLAKAAAPALRAIINPPHRPGSRRVFSGPVRRPAARVEASSVGTNSNRRVDNASRPTTEDVIYDALQKIDPGSQRDVTDHLFEEAPSLRLR